jgi:hypothetical protein
MQLKIGDLVVHPAFGLGHSEKLTPYCWHLNLPTSGKDIYSAAKDTVKYYPPEDLIEYRLE